MKSTTNNIICFCILTLISSSVMAEPFAQALDSSQIKDGYLLSRLKNLAIPEKSEVPVPAYKDAPITYTAKIDSSAEGFFQENVIMYLATTDSPEVVTDFYKTNLPKWKFEKLKTYNLFLKEGDQKFWGGGKHLLKAPRVEIHSLENLGESGDPAKVKLKKELPELNTIFKIFFETSRTKQTTMDIATLVTTCIEKQTASLVETNSGSKMNPAIEKGLRNMAKDTCQRIKKSCDKDINDVRCQSGIHKYK